MCDIEEEDNLEIGRVRHLAQELKDLHGSEEGVSVRVDLLPLEADVVDLHHHRCSPEADHHREILHQVALINHQILIIQIGAAQWDRRVQWEDRRV